MEVRVEVVTMEVVGMNMVEETMEVVRVEEAEVGIPKMSMNVKFAERSLLL